MNTPQAFDLEAFLAQAQQWHGRAHYFPTTSSTNQESRERLRTSGEPVEMVLIADKQLAGRGRLNRPWQAPFATGLLCTLTLPLAPLPLDRAYLYTGALALALQKAAWQEYQVELVLKWPNDLLREGRKCCGILAELEHGLGSNNKASWMALGFGLNIALTERDLTEAGLADKATNVTPPDFLPINREKLLASILANFSVYRQLLATLPEIVRQEWASNLITVGHNVRVLQGNGETFNGTATGVDPSGNLLVKLANGQTQLVQAGDVSVRLSDGRYA
jgi:BirA family transcriptional regulator, biotin operon repressor / biotin---[acetyl-CoA-carboxylase] ligase